MDQIQEIKNRLNIVDIIGEHVELKKAGRTYKACCPFHNEKTPSFTVSAERQLFYCFGCGTGGDVIKFVELIDRVDFREALQTLADRAGVTLEKNKFGPKKETKDLLKEISQTASEFFSQKLTENPAAQDYLKKRGLTPELISAFHLGYAPDDYHALHKHLTRKGYQNKDILEVGLAVSKGLGSNEIYDRFRDRIIFPITSARGDIIAFGGRAQKKSEKAKYLNSSESPIYKKSETLFGLAQARNAFRDTGTAIVVEGYFDMISAYAAGTQNVVAPCGTALTTEQIRTLKRFVKRIIFAFDTDEAGIEATRRAILLAHPSELELAVTQVPSGKDPDEFIQSNPKKWLKINQKPLPAWNFLKKLALEKNNPQDPQDKKQIILDLSEYLQKTQSPLELEHYLKDLAHDLNTSPETLTLELHHVSKKSTTKPTPTTAPKAPKHTPAEILLGFIYLYPDWSTSLDIDLLPDETLKKACIFAQKNYNSKVENNKNDFFGATLAETELEKAKILAFLVEEQYANLPLSLQKSAFQKVLQRVQTDHLKTEQAELKKALVMASKDQNPTEEEKLLQALQNNLIKLKKIQ